MSSILRILTLAETSLPHKRRTEFLYNDMRVVNTARPHVKEVMDALKKRNLRLGIISNTISTTFSPYF